MCRASRAGPPRLLGFQGVFFLFFFGVGAGLGDEEPHGFGKKTLGARLLLGGRESAGMYVCKVSRVK